MPSFCMNLCAMRGTLYFSMVPSEFCLMWKTHLLPTMFLPEGHGTVVHVLAFSKVSISRSITCCHFGQSEQDRTFASVFGLLPASVRAACMSSSTSAKKAKSGVLMSPEMYAEEVLGLGQSRWYQWCLLLLGVNEGWFSMSSAVVVPSP